jgi:hypothetical protein
MAGRDSEAPIVSAVTRAKPSMVDRENEGISAPAVILVSNTRPQASESGIISEGIRTAMERDALIASSTEIVLKKRVI